MNSIPRNAPFHEGELLAQRRAGVGDVAKWAGGFIRDYLPEQHREFHAALPFLIVSGADASGQVWTTLIEGPDGFISTPSPRLVALQTRASPNDPLAEAFAAGTRIGALGVDLSSRRRNRFSGSIQAGSDGYSIDIEQSFGNCPQYIHERFWTRVATRDIIEPERSAALNDEQIALIGGADTMFIGSGHNGQASALSNGYDASHRGGAPGFVRVVDRNHLQIPDYAGNNFFNTIGNLVSDPRVGLLFVDFETGGLLHVTGRAVIDWQPQTTHDPQARRMINVEIEAVIWRPAGSSLRWGMMHSQSQRLRLLRRETETDSITSFYFAPAGDRPLLPFQPGQHLPVSVQIPGQTGVTTRSYSLSGAATDLTLYRLSVKREPHGVMSRFLHDQLGNGDFIEAGKPAGTFVLPTGDGPLVLIGAGVGLTPMVSMLHAAAASGRNTWFVHGARNGNDHALKAEVQDLIARHGNLRRSVFYSLPDPGDLAGRGFDKTGRMSARRLMSLGADRTADYLLCGPPKFIAEMIAGLEDCDVPKTQIHFETFGPSVPSP